jgi:hypothetical protein
MGRVTWNASGGTGTFSPGDSPLSKDQSAPTDARFGGHREVSAVGKDQDYTSRTGSASNRKENPVDDTIKDIDDMTDPNQRKREFSRREETSNVQASNEAGFITKTDSDNRPLEDTDAFEPDGSSIKLRRSKIKGHFGNGQYDNNPNRGVYEGEIR